MDTTGRHLIVECFGCDRDRLEDRDVIEAVLRDAAAAAGAEVVASAFHAFSPHGVTGVVVVEESHLSIHCWPEAEYAAADIFTCGRCVAKNAVAVIQRGLDAERIEVLTLERGIRDVDRSIRTLSHQQEAAQR